MPADFAPGQWGVILGGSSGFGLATARVLADHGLNLCVVHRDRRSQLTRIESEFEKLRDSGIELRTFNLDATTPSTSAMTAGSLGLRASKISVTRGRPPVMSLIPDASRGVLATIVPADIWFPSSTSMYARSGR